MARVRCALQQVRHDVQTSSNSQNVKQVTRPGIWRAVRARRWLSHCAQVCPGLLPEPCTKAGAMSTESVHKVRQVHLRHGGRLDLRFLPAAASPMVNSHAHASLLSCRGLRWAEEQAWGGQTVSWLLLEGSN